MNNKKLCKSIKNRSLCGVCGGIAEFLNVDPNIIRVLWILFACMGGSGIVAYIIIAIILPDDTKVL